MDTDVFRAGVMRLQRLYEEGHRLVVSFSAGKDSGVCLELALLAAKMTGNLPVDVVLRDEEIMYPGTYEYAERVAARPDVRFHWLVAHQPIINIFNREQPYFWVFDPLLPPEQWVRRPPASAITITVQHIDGMTVPERFPPAPGKRLFAVVGLRVQESMGRLYGLFSAKDYITKPNRHGVSSVWPIYDWRDTDVWRAHQQYGWDYNRAYDTLLRLGIPRGKMRIAPPTMNQAGLDVVRAASKAWPQWFDRVCQRLPGVRVVTNFGRRATMPQRHLGETWEQCYQRQCIEEAPAWIADRARTVARKMRRMHRHHSVEPLPDAIPCYQCQGKIGSWKMLAQIMFTGDPFSVKANMLPYVEPEFFRPGAGTWGGKPSW